jgi:NAD(P)-dependent dehydrogenase (short-subunit alcohol dehydrogenase family)
VMPSLIDTPRNRSDMPDADFDTWVKPEEIAALIGFLCSSESSAIHGAAIPISGLV